MPDSATKKYAYRSRADSPSSYCGCTFKDANECSCACNHSIRTNASLGQKCANGLNKSESLDPSLNPYLCHHSKSPGREQASPHLSVLETSVEASDGLPRTISLSPPASNDDVISLDITPLIYPGPCDPFYVWLTKRMFFDRKECAASLPRLILVTLGIWIVASSSLYFLVQACGQGDTDMLSIVLTPMPGLSTFYVMRQLIPRVENPELQYKLWTALICSVYPVCAVYGFMLLMLTFPLYFAIMTALLTYCDMF